MILISSSNPKSNQTTSNFVKSAPSQCGCGLLQAILAQLFSDRYPTTGGEYLELIFTHREMLYAYPQAHRDCALAFSEVADRIERRQWRADREGDGEAAVAFRHEVALVAHTVPW